MLSFNHTPQTIGVYVKNDSLLDFKKRTGKLFNPTDGEGYNYGLERRAQSSGAELHETDEIW